ncbi:hybrid sensor histidine kinase/response regulator [Endozoicomonas sp. OPT23]|nr:hybrid sensor histidine kinase/response regulator [Endozoicomonas sp. OPT23]
MPIRFRDRLSYKQARNTVFIAFALGIFLSLFQVLSDYQSQDEQIDDTIENYIAITRTPAARIAYNIDNELAHELVVGLIKSPHIVQAEIIDPSGNSLASASAPPDSPSSGAFTNMLFGSNRTYIRELKVPFDEEEKLGWLKIIADTSPISSQFIERSLITMTTGLVRTFLLSAVLFFMLYIMLTKPLLLLTDKMVEQPDGSNRIQLPEPIGHEKDEIGLLTRTINHYLNNIHHHLHHRRVAEEQLREHLSELESIIARRTSELRKNNLTLEETNKELEKARSQAMDKATQRTQQLSSLSHEIRTPLNALLGMLNIVLDEKLPDSQQQRLMIARDSGSHLITLLNDILDLSRLDSGKMHLETIPFDLRSSLEDVVVLTGQSAFSKGVPVFCDIDPTLPEEVIGDPTRFHQIITNLIGNAAKFTDSGSIRIWLDCQKESEDTVSIMLNITDTGIGIAKEAIEEIFKPFAQASSDTTRKFGGSGMGLPLTQAIVNSMGGHLTLISEPGKGSTFSVRLPFKFSLDATLPELPSRVRFGQIALDGDKSFQNCCSHLLTHWHLPHRTLEEKDKNCNIRQYSDVLITDNPETALTASQSNSSQRVILASHRPVTDQENLFWLPLPMTRKQLLAALERTVDQNSSDDTDFLTNEDSAGISQEWHILVVEDNPINRMVAEGMLEQLGYQVSLAQNGEECLQLNKHNNYDLILMDCNMPVLDGFKTTRALRSQPATKDIPIIALTANALNDHRKRCMEAGMNDHISKPFDKQQLQLAINTWLIAEPA